MLVAIALLFSSISIIPAPTQGIDGSALADTRISLTRIQINDYMEPRELTRDSQFQIVLSSKNNENRSQKYLTIIEIREQTTGITESLQLINNTMSAFESVATTALWIPEDPGSYEIRAFAISDLEKAEILSPLITKLVTIKVAGGKLSYWHETKPFSIVLIPDTQKYWTSSGNEEIAYNQSKWIVKNRDNLNIQLVVHLGDIVDKSNDDNQWLKADKMMKILDDGRVPYIALAGNHDIGNPYSNSSNRNYKHFQKYFPDSRIVFNQPTLQTEKITPNGANMAAHLTIGENEFFIVSMEYCPSPDVIELLNQAIEQNKDKRIIIATHAFLRSDGTWTSVSGGGVCKKIEGTDDYSTKAIWDLVVYPHPNAFLVLSGHSSGENKRIDNNIAGNPVQQVVIDYQYKRNGGDGMLKIITFYPDKDMIYFESYSPWFDSYQSRDRSKFNFEYDMN